VLLGLLAVSLIVGAIISVSAIVDPFSLMPPVGEIWEDCSSDCALADRFPGFWLHAGVNLVYLVAVVALAVAVAGAVADLRSARARRFGVPGAHERYAEAREVVAGVSIVMAVFAAAPIVVALL
jgi:hypothetical protein